MNLVEAKLKQLDNLTANERATLRCRLAAEFTHTGQYEAAREALGPLWQGIGERPALKGLANSTAAEVLLQCGVLSGWLGSSNRIEGVQEKAKDLINEALRIFQSLNQKLKVAEARYELGMCYWRLGAFDEARIVLDEAVERLGEDETELKAKILIRHTLVEIWTGRYLDAWDILKNAESVFGKANDALKGRWHGQKGIVLLKLGTTQGRADYADRAIIEFTAAIFHYEQAKHERYCGTNLNNLAFLLYKLGRYKEAHENLNRARAIFSRLKDSGNIAQVDETRARVLIAEKRYQEARQIINEVINTFERNEEQALLADALTIKATIQARLGEHESSLHVFRRAINVAENAGALINAGLAAVTMIEEHGKARLSEYELYHIYHRADRLLAATQDVEDIARLRACANILNRKLFGKQLSDSDFRLRKVVREYEARFIEQALREEQGIITHAAKRLGISYQSLQSILKTRQRKLFKKRKPPANRQT